MGGFDLRQNSGKKLIQSEVSCISPATYELKTTFLSAPAPSLSRQRPDKPPRLRRRAAAPALSATPDTTAIPPVAAVSTTPLATATVTPSATVPPTTAPTASPDTEDEFDSAIEKQIRKHFSVDFDDGHSGHDSDMPWIAVPIVLIVFLTIFGLPVAVVESLVFQFLEESRHA